MDRVLGVLAGRDLPLKRLATWARSATCVIAADGAADQLLEAGVRPHVVVGDMDSIQAGEIALQGIEILRSDDQESTDADKLLAYAAERRYKAVTLVGLEGDRLDHMLAALGSAAGSGLEISFGLRTGWGRVLRPGVSPFDLPAETTISVLPLGACTGVSMRGVAWPLHEIELSLGGRVSISNRALGGAVQVEIGEGTALFVAGTGPEPHW